MERHRLGIALSIATLSLTFACRSVSGDRSSDLASLGTDADRRASEIHQAVALDLRTRYPTTQNQVWFESRASFADDWIVQSPVDYWDKDAKALPINLNCDPSKGAGCDSVFSRKLCSVDQDCTASQSTCQELLASVTKPGESPRKMCLGSGDKLMDHFYKVMTSADEQLDIASLAYPTGRFVPAYFNALAYLSNKAKTPKIRMIFSGKKVLALNIIQHTHVTLQEIIDGVNKAGGDASKLNINIGWLSSKTKPSWNHSKIMVADQKLMIQGGHNLYDPDYLSDNPIFDLSMEVSGLVAKSTVAFIDQLWLEADDVSVTPKDSKQIVMEPLPSPPSGKSRVIGMGRLGYNHLMTNKKDNPSDQGIISLLNAAKSTLDFAQQDMFHRAAPIAPISPSWALEALGDALVRGVKVRIVQSGEASTQGYGMVDFQVTHDAIIKVAMERAKKASFKTPNGQDLKAYLCEHLELAPWHFNKNDKTWVSGVRLGSHPKLIIADSVSFYLGSQNFYPANLQEYGMVVSDPAITEDLIKDYWSPLWAASGSYKAECK